MNELVKILISILITIVIQFSPLIAAPPQFESPINYSVGSEPQAVALADLDGDNDIDMAIANMAGDNISVFKNDGIGNFGYPTNYAIGNGPSSICAGDFDRDGDNDLAVSLFDAGSVKILINDGDGNFVEGGDYVTNLYAYTIICADLDGDSMLDLVTTNSSVSSLAILKNMDSANFAEAIHLNTNLGPHGITPFHLYRDSYLDLAVACSGSNNVNLIRNRRNGTMNFTLVASYAAGIGPVGICSADFDNDGDDDLLTANPGSDNLTLLRNNGDRTFQVVDSNYTTGGDPTAVIADDFNGDGAIDAAVANHYSGSLSILENAGDGAFKNPVHFLTGSSPQAIASADLDNDGDRDIIVVNSGSNNVSVFFNKLNQPTDINEDTQALVPEKMILKQNHPNPFNPTTSIEFYLPRKTNVRMDIYNLLGQQVRTLIDRTMPVGNNMVLWDGRNDQGDVLPSGIYFYRFAIESYSATRKMILIR